MCELFAIDSSYVSSLEPFLGEFFAHGEKHPHGWGLAIRSESGVALEKEPVSAVESAYLKERLRNPICAAHAIAHIRYATIGELNYDNCHPFVRTDSSGRTWVLAHNGTTFNSEPIAPFFKDARGGTDSEAILLGLLAHIEDTIGQKGSALTAGERFEALESIIAAFSVGNKLNLIIDDGEFTYLHTNYLKESLFLLQSEGTCICSTKPLSEDAWRPVPLTRLIALRDGEVVHQGRPHGNVYIENPDDVKYLYQSYAML